MAKQTPEAAKVVFANETRGLLHEGMLIQLTRGAVWDSTDPAVLAAPYYFSSEPTLINRTTPDPRVAAELAEHQRRVDAEKAAAVAVAEDNRLAEVNRKRAELGIEPTDHVPAPEPSYSFSR